MNRGAYEARAWRRRLTRTERLRRDVQGFRDVGYELPYGFLEVRLRAQVLGIASGQIADGLGQIVRGWWLLAAQQNRDDRNRLAGVRLSAQQCLDLTPHPVVFVINSSLARFRILLQPEDSNDDQSDSSRLQSGFDLC